MAPGACLMVIRARLMKLPPGPFLCASLSRRFMAFDRHMNLVIGDAEEFRKLPPKKGKSDTEVRWGRWQERDAGWWWDAGCTLSRAVQ